MGSYGGGDLEAVVRGYTSSTISMENFENTFSIHQDELVSNSYPEFFESDMFFNELEALYKPFYPTMKPYSSSSTSSLCSKEIEELEEIKPSIASHETNKYKKRKNKQKRVVMQVKEDNLSSHDKWAWRKYGQKPIKGSPYPRSYYRCSSSKGCIARKQVERSFSDSETFIITYTADHCHPLPTRRNSLAGTTRNKFPKGPSNTNSSTINISHEPSEVDTSSSLMHPMKTDIYSPSNSPIEITSQQEIFKSEKEEWEQFEDMVLRDDFDEMVPNVNYDMLESINWFNIQ